MSEMPYSLIQYSLQPLGAPAILGAIVVPSLIPNSVILPLSTSCCCISTSNATSAIKKTHIMYRANLSYEQVYLYLEELISKRLIVQDLSADGVVYRTTEKGREFLLYYTHLVQFLEEEKEEEQQPRVELSSPYVRRS
jgi:predicted transcriptional regulator